MIDYALIGDSVRTGSMAEILELSDDNGESICKFLEGYIQSGNLNFLIGSGASFPAIGTAGNIEETINAFLKEGKEKEAHLESVGFIEKINDVHLSLQLTALDAATEDVTKTLAGYRGFATALDKILFARKNLLLPRQANVFTTNYDMFLEHASSLLPGLQLNDGFDRSCALDNDFPFAPERYFDRIYRSGSVYGNQIEMPTINLIKLHGSLSWRRSGNEVIFDPVAKKKLTKEEKTNETKVGEYLEKHFLILPNFRKFNAVLMDRIYYDLLRLFANAMEKGNAVLFSFGFSFADEHILDITRRALRNPTSQLIIFSFDHASAAGYKEKFSSQRNVTVMSPQNGTYINFERFNGLLASVLPVGDMH